MSLLVHTSVVSGAAYVACPVCGQGVALACAGDGVVVRAGAPDARADGRPGVAAV